MPRPPGIIDRVNYIVDFVQDPCEAPWTVYLETAIQPAGNLVMVLLDFDPLDIVRAYFRPAALRKGGHFGRRTRRRRRGGGIPDLNEAIGKRIPGQRAVARRTVSRGVRFLWAIDGVLQRVFFWWLVIDVTTQFLYEWGTLVNETEYCQQQDAGVAYADGDGGGFPAISGWVGVNIPNIIKQRGDASWERNATAVPTRNAHIAVDMDVRNHGVVSSAFELRLRRVSPDPKVITSDSTGELDINATSGAAVAAWVPPGVYTVEGRASRGNIEGIGAQAHVITRPNPS